MLAKLKNLCHMDRGVTPLPKMIVSIIFFLVFLQGMIISSVFSYLPELVELFGYSQVDIGLYEGLIASSFFVGKVIFSLIWGYLADLKGQKLAIIASTICLLITTLLFCFSNNFTWALVTRFLQGCSSGMLVLSKYLGGKICDKSNMPLFMSIVLTSFTVGLIIGPSLAGFLAFPAIAYPEIFSKDSPLGKFGILLPNLPLVAGLLVTLILLLIFLPKDTKEKKERLGEQSYLLINKQIQHKQYNAVNECNIENKKKEFELYFNLSLEYEENDENGARNKEGKEEYLQIVEPKIDRASPVRKESILTKIKKSPFIQVLRNKWFVVCCVIYTIIEVAEVAMSELFPLYVSTSKTYDGIDFSPADIALVLLIGGAILVIIQLSLIAIIIRKYGAKNTTIASAVIFSIVTPILPVAAQIEKKAVLWTFLVIYLVITRIAIHTAFIAVHILVNISVNPTNLGAANGVAVSVSSIGRAIAPALFGIAYSWCLTNIKEVESNEQALGFPFDQYFTFFVLSLIMLSTVFITCRIPVTLNHPLLCETSNVDFTEETQITNVTVSYFRVEDRKQSKAGAYIATPAVSVMECL